MLRGIAFLSLLAAAALAQDASELFNRAPQSVDDALRARINEFYTAHVKGEFRKAEMLVAEDTKDYFYNHDKPQYLGFEIVRIEYSNGYTRAKATVSVEEHIMFPGFAGKVMKIPTPSYWKIDDGKWFWYIDKEKLNETPWGVMKAGPTTAGDTNPAAIMAALPSSPEELLNLVHAEKSEVLLNPGETANIMIDNGMKGPIRLSIQGKVEGVEALLDHDTVPAGEKATLTVKAAKGAKSGTITVMAPAIGKSMPIRVTVN